MLSGKRKKDYAAESAAEALAAQAPPSESSPEMQSFAAVDAEADDSEAASEKELVAA